MERLQADDLMELLSNDRNANILVIRNWAEFLTLLFFVRSHDGEFISLNLPPYETAEKVKDWLSDKQNQVILKAITSQEEVKLLLSPAIALKNNIYNIKTNIGSIEFANT